MDLPIAFATRKDGANVAYTTMGAGPPLVYPPGAFSRLEMELTDPIWLEFYHAIAADHQLIFWDRHGVGYSDRERTDFTWDDDVLDMEAVVDALGLDRFAIFGISDGGPIAITYISRHPERVTSLVLYGTTAHENDADFAAKRAIGDVIRTDWWLGTRALVLMFVPSAPVEAAGPLAKMLSDTSTAEVSASLWEMTSSISHLLPQVTVPCLVFHRRDDRVVPFEAGGALARDLPDARFIPLPGENHPPPFGDWNAIVEPMLTFLKQVESGELTAATSVSTGAGVSTLSRRELDVLRLVAKGKSNPEIAEELFITRSTVQNHVGSILIKTNLGNRTEAAVYAREHGIA